MNKPVAILLLTVTLTACGPKMIREGDPCHAGDGFSKDSRTGFTLACSQRGDDPSPHWHRVRR